MSEIEKSKTNNRLHGSLPPMFAENFRDNGPEWRKLSEVDFEGIGRVLACHLILEHYLVKFIELQTPVEFDWDESKMTFAQKIKLVRRSAPLVENDFIKGIEVINRIRNKYSHNLLVTIAETDISTLQAIISAFRKSTKSPNQKNLDDVDNIIVIETFTSLVCAFIAGYCSFIVMHEKKTKC